MNATVIPWLLGGRATIQVPSQVACPLLSGGVPVLQFLQALLLLDPQPAILLALTIMRLLHDLRFVARLCRRLPVGYSHFDLSKQIH